MSRLTKKFQVVEQVTPYAQPFNPSDLLPIDEVARRLHCEISWIREKIRRRCPNPLPVYNLGRHLIFEWSKVCEWIRQSGRGQAHTKHHRARKKAA